MDEMNLLNFGSNSNILQIYYCIRR